MQEGSRKQTDAWTVVQTIVLIATAGGIFLTLGKRDQEISYNTERISELRDISTDLVRSQVLSEANDSNHKSALDDLKRRIEKLEDSEG